MKQIRRLIPSFIYRLAGYTVISSSDIDWALDAATSAIGDIPSDLSLAEVIKWKPNFSVICPLHVTLTGFRIVLKKNKED